MEIKIAVLAYIHWHLGKVGEYGTVFHRQRLQVLNNSQRQSVKIITTSKCQNKTHDLSNFKTVKNHSNILSDPPHNLRINTRETFISFNTEYF